MYFYYLSCKVQIVALETAYVFYGFLFSLSETFSVIFMGDPHSKCINIKNKT